MFCRTTTTFKNRFHLTYYTKSRLMILISCFVLFFAFFPIFWPHRVYHYITCYTSDVYCLTKPLHSRYQLDLYLVFRVVLLASRDYPAQRTTRLKLRCKHDIQFWALKQRIISTKFLDLRDSRLQYWYWYWKCRSAKRSRQRQMWRSICRRSLRIFSEHFQIITGDDDELCLGIFVRFFFGLPKDS